MPIALRVLEQLGARLALSLPRDQHGALALLRADRACDTELEC